MIIFSCFGSITQWRNPEVWQIEQLQAALQSDPKNVTARQALAQALLRKGQVKEAQAELKKKNLTVSSIVEQKGGPKKTGLFGPPRPHVKTKDIAVMEQCIDELKRHLTLYKAS